MTISARHKRFRNAPPRRRDCSFLKLVSAAAGRHEWTPAWRKPAPRASYDAVLIGGGGHGLAAAYYLDGEVLTRRELRDPVPTLTTRIRIGRLAVLVHGVGPDCIDILVPRSHARSFFEQLRDAAELEP